MSPEPPHGHKRKRTSNSLSAQALSRPTIAAASMDKGSDLKAVSTLTASLDSLRTVITCKVCFRLLYEPFTLSCGHTYCYGCLRQWLGRKERKKTCPDYRTPIRHAPAPAFTVREITQKLIEQPAFLADGETCEQHAQWQAEESALLENDKARAGENGGLFGGRFKSPRSPQTLMFDAEDGVERCPLCGWEAPDWAGYCEHCGFEDAGSEWESSDEPENGSEVVGSSRTGSRTEADRTRDSFEEEEELDGDLEAIDNDLIDAVDGSHRDNGYFSELSSTGTDSVASRPSYRVDAAASGLLRPPFMSIHARRHRRVVEDESDGEDGEDEEEEEMGLGVRNYESRLRQTRPRLDAHGDPDEEDFGDSDELSDDDSLHEFIANDEDELSASDASESSSSQEVFETTQTLHRLPRTRDPPLASGDSSSEASDIPTGVRRRLNARSVPCGLSTL